ncbi:MAG: hypothetical protein A2148_07410 [Chloroflexi bacterium RBG_16_68_14]|nr:MAG: hypothetical protein A2148_07410 [Chloroflexi bacterium RBG_16_68_14]
MTLTPTRTLFSQVSPTVVGPTPGGSLGDVNCDGVVDSIDAFLILWFEASVFGILPCPENADVSLDGLVNSLDALLILQYHAQLVPSLPPPGLAGEGWMELVDRLLPSLW